MPASIQVVLQSDVPNVGKSGDLVKVRPGFARNYLLPRQLAVPATAAQVNRVSHEKSVAIPKAEKARKEARVPPHDLDAEAAVLSAIMIDGAALDKVLEFLKPEHFYSEAHRRIYEACI